MEPIKVLTANIDKPNSDVDRHLHRRRRLRVRAQSAGDEVGRDHPAREGLRAPRTRRRGLPDRDEVVVRPAQRAEADLPALQRRRGGAGHVQGPRHHREGSAPPHRGDDHLRVRDRLESDGVHLHPRRVPLRRDGARESARGSAREGLPRQEHLRQRLRLRHHRPSRRGRVHLRRGDGAHRVGGRPSRPAARQAAVPGGRRRVRRTDGRAERRDAGLRAADRQERRGLVQVVRHAEEHRPEALLRLRQGEEAGRVRVPDGDHAQGADLRPLRRHHRRPQAEGGHPRRRLGADAHCRTRSTCR